MAAQWATGPGMSWRTCPAWERYAPREDDPDNSGCRPFLGCERTAGEELRVVSVRLAVVDGVVVSIDVGDGLVLLDEVGKLRDTWPAQLLSVHRCNSGAYQREQRRPQPASPPSKREGGGQQHEREHDALHRAMVAVQNYKRDT